MAKQLRISILIPCHNEDAGIEATLESCFGQSREFDQIVVVDDFSTDSTPEILARYADRITVVRTPKNLGNKSFAQQFGLDFVTGDIMVTTDGDTILHEDFVRQIEMDFDHNPKLAAVCGYVKSLKHNWLTRCRAFEYAIGQNLHKLAQDSMDYVFVLPGAAAAFNTEVFRTYLKFEHDTITEDLDFTYKLHKNRLKICYNRKAIVYTQDPATISSYVKQMRRWLGGGWQALLKHYKNVNRPSQALELALNYIEGTLFSITLFVLPLISLWLTARLLLIYLAITQIFSVYAAIKERRADLLLAPIPYLFLTYVNCFIFLEQFVLEVIYRKRNLLFLSPERVKMQTI